MHADAGRRIQVIAEQDEALGAGRRVSPISGGDRSLPALLGDASCDVARDFEQKLVDILLAG
jgi:hypothetical protein